MLKTRIAKTRGMSIVELMVGIAIGLFIVAGGSKMLADNLIGNRRLIIESRISQDLRAATDIIARDIRRAGYWQNALSGVSDTPIDNAYRVVTPSPASGVASGVAFTYSTDATEDNAVSATAETFGYDRAVVNGVGVLRSNVGGSMQMLTDPASVDVTAFQVTPITGEVSLGQACRNTATGAPACCQPHPDDPSRCLADSVEIRPGASAGTTTMLPADPIAPNGATVTANCPMLVIRRFEIVVRGTAPVPNNDISREIRETVRVRNDEVRHVACP